MSKRFMQLAAAVLAVCLAIPPAGALTTNNSGQVMIRVGLASSSSHVPTAELEAAHLENNNSEGHGNGYRFGYYDSSLNFIELARTDASTIQVTVLKAQNLYYGSVGGKKTYSSSITSSILVGCYHVRVSGSYNNSSEAAAAASQYSGGFVAWIDGAYQVRVGAYGTKEEAQAAMGSISGAAEVVGTSSYGMNVVKTGTNRILFQYDCGQSGRLGILPDVTNAAEPRTWFSGYKYRGGFQYHRRTGGNLTVVNVVELEDYVNGVVCYEMGREWPLEALKAQAICARTYVMKNLGKHNDYGFDICTSASCQVYYGMGSKRPDYGPSAVSMQAVAETAGMVIKYNGKLAETFYSSSFGGASEDAKNVWGTDTTGTYPYLRGVTDPYEADLDSANAYSPWTKSYTSAQLTQQLQSTGIGTGTSVDRLELTYSPLGNVIQVVVRWANGKSSTISAGSIRSKFDVRSIRFTINGAIPDGTAAPSQPSDASNILVNGTGKLDSLDGKYVISGTGSVSRLDGAAYAISGTGSLSEIGGSSANSGNSTTVAPTGGGTVTVSGSTYNFSGAGWGHQVGMSQYGANAMARRGFTGSEIVEFYFPGVRVTHY